jgi:hypothetical protein
VVGAVKHETEIMGHRLIFRTWTYGMKQEALKKATTWRRGVQGDMEPDVDPWTFNDLMLLQTLIKWDLEDGNGQPLLITLKNIHDIEPPELVEEMIAYAQRINGVTVEERKKS